MSKILEPIPPGEILLEEFMMPLGLSQNRLARDLGVPVGRLNEIIKGKRAITADTALRLHRYFGVSAEFWMNLQAHYELRLAKRDLWPVIKTQIRARRAA